MPTRYDQLPEMTVYSPTDGRMILKRVDCTADALKRQPCGIGTGLEQEFDYALEVSESVV